MTRTVGHEKQAGYFMEATKAIASMPPAGHCLGALQVLIGCPLSMRKCPFKNEAYGPRVLNIHGLFHTHKPSRNLRSTSSLELQTPVTRTKTVIALLHTHECAKEHHLLYSETLCQTTSKLPRLKISSNHC